MKLLIYSHYFLPSVGGVETIVLALATGLALLRTANGSPAFDITLVTQTHAANTQDDLFPFRVIRRPSASMIRRLMRDTEVVHVAGPALLPILYGFFYGRPVVVEHHGFQVICPTGQLFQEPENVPCPGNFMSGRHSACLRCSPVPDRIASARLWVLTFVRRFLCRYVAVNITPTTWLAAQIQLPRSETIHHGLSTSSNPIREASNETPMVVFLGRLVTTKGVKLLIEAARILHNAKRPFKLLIVGDGPERASLEAVVNEWGMGAQVLFLGHQPETHISELFRKAKLVVVPSLGGEVFGMVIAENMLRGIPVIASDLGAFVEVLGDAGFTFKTGDSTDLAHQIDRVLRHPSLLEQSGTVARRRALECFSMDQMIERHSLIYTRLSSPKFKAAQKHNILD